MTPQVSDRARQMPASPIRKLMPLAEDARRRGVHVHHLNIGQPDIETPAPMRERLAACRDKVFAYTPSGGTPEYLATILEYYGRLSGVAANDRSRKVSEVLERVGLPTAAGTQLRRFSKGMLQRVGIAQAILHDPKVVFDEPMSGLDPMGRREVRDLMEQLKHQGKTVFFSTHILSDAEALCDRVAIIHQGELRGIGAVADLTSSVHGNVELVWQGDVVPQSLRTLGAECHMTGDTVRAIVAETRQDAAMEALRREGLRLISLTPVRMSLEDYFVQQLKPAEATVEVSS